MATITKLQAGKRDPTRVNLFLDRRFAFSLSAEAVIAHGIKVGQELDDESVQSLSSLSSEEKILSKILNYLSYRPRSRREVEQRLQKYLRDLGEPDSVISATLTKLERLGYIDDESFARWFVESRKTSRPRSRRHLASELAAKGISGEIVNHVIRDLADDNSAIQALIAKKASLPPDKLKAYLARRGFSYSLIQQALLELDS